MKIAVLGLGPSLSLYKPEYDLAIGVNDIWKYVRTDIVVCVDERERFAPERMQTIDQCNPLAFYSHIDSYSDRPDFHKIELQPYLPNYVCQLNIPQYPKSMCSPFVACAVAYKDYKATEIHLFGVDLLDHPNLKKDMCEQIKRHFKNMLIELRMNDSNLLIHGNGILSKLGH